MKRLLFISMLLMMTTALFGQKVILLSDPAHPCIGDEVVFSAAFKADAKKTFSLYYNSNRLEKISSTQDTVQFASVKLASGYYLVKVKCENQEYTSDRFVVNAPVVKKIKDAICYGEDYNSNGFNITKPSVGLLHDTLMLQNSNGCDSITKILELRVNRVYETEITDEICQGEDYLVNGFSLHSPSVGVHHESINKPTVNGCDSIVNLTLTVHPEYQFAISAEICEGEDYDLNGFNLHAPKTGSYTLKKSTVHGCDSIINLALTVNKPSQTSIKAQICEGEDYTENGFRVIAPSVGVHRDTLNLRTVHGCDSIVTLRLTVTAMPTAAPVKATICSGGSYRWYGQDYTETGTYQHIVPVENGCDTLATLVLKVEDLEVAIAGDPSLCHNNSAVYSVANINNATYNWTVNGGTVTKGVGTRSITVLWDNLGSGRVSVQVETDGCTASDAMAVTVDSNVGSLNDIQVKKTKEGVAYMLIYKNPEEGLKYQWYKDNEPISGANGQYYMVESGLTTGVYKVYVSHTSDTNGNLTCGAFANPVEISGTRAVFSIFPNPAGEGSQLYLVGIEEHATVNIYTIDGRRIHQIQTDVDGELPVRLSHGCYFVEIIDALQNRQIEKLIIK